MFGRPPDGKVMEVYNDFNSNLANLYSCVREQTWEFLRDLGFLPLNSRDEFNVIRQFLDKGEFDAPFMARELELGTAKKIMVIQNTQNMVGIYLETTNQFKVV